MPPTDTKNIETLLQMQFEDAPEDMQTLLKSPEFQNTVLGIGELYELDPSAQNELLNEVTLVCLGLSSIETLPQYVLPLVGNDRQKADEIATHIFDTVLYENIALIPTALTPRAEHILTAMEGEATNAPAVQSTDVPQATQQTTPPPETPGVPRYARPVTDAPRYTDTNET